MRQVTAQPPDITIAIARIPRPSRALCSLSFERAAAVFPFVASATPQQATPLIGRRADGSVAAAERGEEQFGESTFGGEPVLGKGPTAPRQHLHPQPVCASVVELGSESRAAQGTHEQAAMVVLFAGIGIAAQGHGRSVAEIGPGQVLPGHPDACPMPPFMAAMAGQKEATIL